MGVVPTCPASRSSGEGCCWYTNLTAVLLCAASAASGLRHQTCSRCCCVSDLSLTRRTHRGRAAGTGALEDDTCGGVANQPSATRYPTTLKAHRPTDPSTPHPSPGSSSPPSYPDLPSLTPPCLGPPSLPSSQVTITHPLTPHRVSGSRPSQVAIPHPPGHDCLRRLARPMPYRHPRRLLRVLLVRHGVPPAHGTCRGVGRRVGRSARPGGGPPAVRRLVVGVGCQLLLLHAAGAGEVPHVGAVAATGRSAVTVTLAWRAEAANGTRLRWNRGQEGREHIVGVLKVVVKGKGLRLEGVGRGRG